MSSDEDAPDSDNDGRPDEFADDGEWIGGEFFSAKRQKRRHQTKEVRVSPCVSCRARPPPRPLPATD